MDIPNKISKRGLIYFPDFCQLVLEKFRGDAVEGENFRQNMFKVIKISSEIEEPPLTAYTVKTVLCTQLRGLI